VRTATARLSWMLPAPLCRSRAIQASTFSVGSGSSYSSSDISRCRNGLVGRNSSSKASAFSKFTSVKTPDLNSLFQLLETSLSVNTAGAPKESVRGTDGGRPLHCHYAMAPPLQQVAGRFQCSLLAPRAEDPLAEREGYMRDTWRTVRIAGRLPASETTPILGSSGLIATARGEVTTSRLFR